MLDPSADKIDSVEWHVQEGEAIEPIKHCATVRGPMRKILLGERVALNTMARCSGIATKYAAHLHLQNMDIYIYISNSMP